MALFANKSKNRTVAWATAPQPPKMHNADVIDGMWDRCASCNEILYNDDLVANLRVCPNCGHHFRLSARQRIGYTADEGSFEETQADLVGADPLEFPGYMDKLTHLRAGTGEREAIVTGTCTIQGYPCVLAVMDAFFMMGSMGCVVG